MYEESLITSLHSQELPIPGSGNTSMTNSTAERRDSVSGSVGSAPSSPATSRASDGPSSLPAEPPAPYVNEAIRKYVSQELVVLPSVLLHPVMISFAVFLHDCI